METTAIALALSGSMADRPARFVFKVLEELDNQKKKDDDKKQPDATT
jgi:hypothetical protein